MEEKKRSYEVNRDFCRKLNDTINDVTMAFVHKYFWDEGTNNFCGDLHWIESQEKDLHYNLFINDYYFSLDTIFTALWFNVPANELFERYDHVQRSYMEGSTHHSLKNRYSLHHPYIENV